MINNSLLASADRGSAHMTLLQSTDLAPASKSSKTLGITTPASEVVEKRKVWIEIRIISAYVSVSKASDLHVVWKKGSKSV